MGEILIKHVGLIPDGNRRWADDNKVTRQEGHRAGMKNMVSIIEKAADLGIPMITPYAFSTENNNRGDEQKDELMQILDEGFSDPNLDRLLAKGIAVNVIGNYQELLPSAVREKVEEAKKRSNTNERTIVNFALNYGGRQEIIYAAEQVRLNHPGEVITKELFEQYLYTAGMPDVDMVIRTGAPVAYGNRTSNFLPWQTVYAEWVFRPEYFPDYSADMFKEDYKAVQTRQRNLGK